MTNIMSSSTEPPVRLAGRTLKETRHVCAFFNSREEQNKTLMPFFKEGFDRGEKLFISSMRGFMTITSPPVAIAASRSKRPKRTASLKCAIGKTPT